MQREALVLVLAAAFFVSGSSAAAQGGLAVEGGAVHALPPAGSGGEALTYGTLDLHGFFIPRSRWTLTGGVSGARALEGEGHWVVGDLGGHGRVPLGSRAGLELTTTLAWFRVSTTSVYEAVVARMVPAVRWRAGRSGEVALRAHGGVGQSISRGRLSPIEVVEDLTLLGAGVEGSRLVGPVRLRAAADAYQAGDGSSWALVAGGEGPLGPARLEASVQLWSGPESSGGERVVFLGSVSVPLGGRASLRSSGGRSAPDPLLGTLPGTYGAALLHVDLPVGTAASFEPAARWVGPEPGRVRFTWPGPAEGVQLLGDFSAWEPLNLALEDGAWSAEAVLPPGVHHYGFRVDGEWMVPEQVMGRTLDEWGGPTATVVVAERPVPAVDVQGDEAAALGTTEPPGDVQGGPVTALRTTWPPLDGAARSLVDAAGRQGLPTGPLLGKAREGAAKGVAAAEVVRALELYAVDVGRASELMGAASSAADLTAAADALRRGVPEEAVVQLAPVLSGVGRTLSLVALGDLVGDGVPAEPAFDLVHLAGGRDAAAEILPVVPLVVRQLVRQGWAAADAALQVEDAIARGRPPPFVELGALGGGGKPPVPPGTGAPGMMGGMMGPGGG